MAARAGRHEARHCVSLCLRRGAGAEPFAGAALSVRHRLGGDRPVRRPDHPRGGDRPCNGVRHQGRRARFARADRLGLHRRGFRRRRGRVHHADRRAARGPDRREGTGRHREARPPDAADRAASDGRRRDDRAGRACKDRRPPARAARRERPGGRRDSFGADLDQPGGDDGRIAAGGQGRGRPGFQRHGQPVRRV